VSVPVTGLIPLPYTPGRPVTVTATVTATGPTTTTLLVGAADPFTATLDGRPLPAGDAVPLTLAPGEHTVTLTVKPGGRAAGLTLRLLDPDRKLTAGR
jgi:hypothetical protein